MAEVSKGKSPFYPGQPVPLELFVGREQEIARIVTRGAGQVSQGKPVAVFTQGEYGIGKSSIASYVSYVAEHKHQLHCIYVTLGGCSSLTDVAASVLQATLTSGALDTNRGEEIRNWLAKYVGEQGLFGISLNLQALKKDAPNFSTPQQMLGFLGEVRSRLKDAGVKGIFLVLDEINGMTSDPQFAHFLKGLVDSNALSNPPIPLLLMLCGVEEKRRELIQNHEPVERIFDVVEIGALSRAEMEQFFAKAFSSVQMRVDPDAMRILTDYSAGFPKIMHLVGDVAFWQDRDGLIDADDATSAVVAAAQDVGTKYVDQQIYKALRSHDYLSILKKLGKAGPTQMTFTRAELISDLTSGEKKKFDNFITKMKKLKVLRKGDVRGEYQFIHRMVRLYIFLQSARTD